MAHHEPLVWFFFSLLFFFFLFSLPMQVIILLQKLPLANTREMVYSFFTYSREITRLLFHILKMMSFFPTHIFFSSSLSPSFFKLSIWFSHFPFHFQTHCYLVNCQPERNICCVYSICTYLPANGDAYVRHKSGADVLLMPSHTNKCKILRDRSRHSRSL